MTEQEAKEWYIKWIDGNTLATEFINIGYEMGLIDNKKPEPIKCDIDEAIKMLSESLSTENLIYKSPKAIKEVVNCRCEIKPMELRNKHDRYKQSIYNKCYRVDEY